MLLGQLSKQRVRLPIGASTLMQRRLLNTAGMREHSKVRIWDAEEL